MSAATHKTPEAPDAERGLIACMLAAPDQVIPPVLERTAGQSVFLDPACFTLGHTALALHARSGTFDRVMLMAELRDRGRLDEIGGAAFLDELDNSIPSPLNWPHYLDLVWEKYLARQAISTARETAIEVRERGFDATSVTRIQRRVDALAALAARGSDLPPRHLKEPVELEQQFYDFLANHRRLEHGLPLPFKFPFGIRHGETTIVSGDDGSGKSTLLGHVCVELAMRGQRICVASLEMPPEVTLFNLTRQLYGGHIETARDAQGHWHLTPRGQTAATHALAWLQRHFLIYDFQGIATWHELLDCFRYVADKDRARIFVLDSVMRIGIADDDYGAQGLASAQFAQWSQQARSHLFLVIHQNKGDHKGKAKIRGSGLWRANAHNITEVIRNEDKKAKLDEAEQKHKLGEITDEQLAERRAKSEREWDTKFCLHKQRFPGSRQNAARYLFFDHAALQFHEQPDAGPVRYIDPETGKEMT